MKKLARKTLTIALSLAMCAGMVAPAFAAVEFNKDVHVEADTGALKQNDEGNYDYYLGGDVTLDKTLVVGEGVDASIDLNGHTLKGSGTGSVIEVNGSRDNSARLTVSDSTAEHDEEGNQTYAGDGKITGGTGHETANGKTYGGGVYVGKNGILDIEGGEISGNSATYGGGVYLYEGSYLTMNGGSISGNTAAMDGGGVYSNVSTALYPGKTELETNQIVVNDGSISGNSARNGGGISASNTNIFISGNGSISGNDAQNGGGVSFLEGQMVMNGGTVSGNDADKLGGGIQVNSNGSLFVWDGTICENTAEKGGGIEVSGSSKLTNGKWEYEYGMVMLQDLELSSSHIYGNTADASGDDIQTDRLGYVWLKETDGWHSDAAGDRDSGEGAPITDTTVRPNQALKSDHVPHTVHSWDEGVETIQPTHMAAGKMTYTCTVCGGTRTEAIPALAEHSWDEGTVTKAPTCAEEGETTYTCQCGETRTESIEKAEHTPAEAVRENEVPAQVGVEGSYDEVVKCSVCGEELSREGKTLPALAQPAPVIPDVSGTPDDLPDEVVELDDEDVPLAGLPMELQPEDRLTRGQIIAILHWMDGSPAARLSSFLDVAADSGFAVAIGWAQGNDIADGITESEFAPDQFVTRGQLIDFLNRYARYVGSDLVLEVEGDPGEVLTWAMAEEIINDFFTRLYA